MPQKARLLIAEDEQIIALGMQIFLSDAGYEVCGIAKTAPEAVDLAERHRPDLALLDVRLAEGTDGTEAAARLRADLAIPAILVTGHLDQAQARATGAIGLLKKPYDPQRLLDMIDAAVAWMRDGTTPASSILGLFVGDLPPLRRVS